ncbi:MAG: DUF2304 domain-containing protein [Actinomycetaceae bacterium]|nr:DUF2304 domain-containing protein [Actinomycetaceae bacterium]
MLEILGSQWVAKITIVAFLIAVTYIMMKPVKSASHLALRRLGMMLFVLFAVIAAVFPGLVSRVAFFFGIGRGTDFLLYGLTLVFFGSVVTSYRRDSANDKKLTHIARTIALRDVRGGPNGYRSDEQADSR